MDLAKASLDDKYTQETGRGFLTRTQALIRVMLLQRERDLRAGLNTAGFVSGYRGSPLGGLDQALWRAQKHLATHHVKFQPGVNEDLAATAIWGSQQLNLFPGARYDGVFGMWYGKGPGVDRCGDVFKHANSAGTSKNGGVLVLAGDGPQREGQLAFARKLLDSLLRPRSLLMIQFLKWFLARPSRLVNRIIVLWITALPRLCVWRKPAKR